MILANVSVRQNIIPKVLGISQSRAVPKHQPSMWPKNGDVICDGFRVGRADADVNHCNAGTVRTGQVIGRHLRQLAKWFARSAIACGDDVPRFDQRFVIGIRVLQGSFGEVQKLVHIELVVREKYVVLEMCGAGCSVMCKACQRIIHTLCGERCQRAGAVGFRFIRAVGNQIVGGFQIRNVEHITQRALQPVFDRAFDMCAFAHCEMQRHWRG